MSKNQRGEGIVKLTEKISLRGSGEALEINLNNGWTLLRQLAQVSDEDATELCKVMGELWCIMPGDSKKDEKIRLPHIFMKQAFDEHESEEVVFYGGTFNPWHEGHRACLDLCPVKNIIVVPDFNPWKDKLVENCWMKYFKLCSLLKETSYSVYPGFLARTKGNPTVQWLPYVKLAKKSLLIGEDNFMKFHEWKDFELLAGSLYHLYVVPRQGTGDLREKQIMRLNGQLSGFREKIIILDSHPFEHLASSKIRT